jgi:hypothetical protein
MADISAGERAAVSRRTIIRVKPEYFSWPPDVQERYRVNMPDEDNFRIRQTVLKALFHIQADTKERLEAACDVFDEAQYLLFNSTLLPMMGIGADSFFLNEYLGDKTILDFETLYDYDFDDYQFQEKALKEENPDYMGKPYRGTLYHTWARLEIDGVFHYASLSMAAGYLYAIIDELGSNKIDALIPHTYVKGKDHGKREGNSTIYDQRIDAGGMELQLEELRHRFHRYMSARYEALLNDFEAQASTTVYLFDRTQGNDPHMDFVFTDKTAMSPGRGHHEA